MIILVKITTQQERRTSISVSRDRDLDIERESESMIFRNLCNCGENRAIACQSIICTILTIAGSVPLWDENTRFRCLGNIM